MHWLPLVAMVIASALPFPHDPASRIVAATTTTTTTATSDLQDKPGTASASTSLLTPHRYASADYSAHQPQDYKSVDYNMADRERQSRKDLFLSSTRDNSEVYELNRVNTLDAPPSEGQKNAEISAHLDYNANVNMQDLAVSSRNSPDLDSQWTEEGFDEDLNMLDGLFEGGDIFLDAHPRVLFSTSASPPEHPPELLMFEEDDASWDVLAEGHGDSPDGERTEPKREKRSPFDGRWVQRSVCESENRWVTDKTTAVDTRGNKVSIIQEIQTQSGPIKQYFYETRCRQAEHPQRGRYEETGVEGASCLGIDKKQWKSKCIVKQSYVRALTKDANNRVGWRWIRIDSSCVCVLMSRTNSRGQGREVMPSRGKG